MPVDALSVFCAQLTRDLLAIAKFLLVPVKTLFNFQLTTLIHKIY